MKTKSFFKKPVGILSVVVAIPIVLSIVNYLISNQPEALIIDSHIDGNTSVFVSSQRQGDFWNFARSEDAKNHKYIPESQKIHIFSRIRSIWELEQEILRENL